MIEILPESKDKILGIKVSGELTDRDYRDVLIPTLETIIEKHGKGRFLCAIDQTFSGMELGAMWDDTRFYLKHWNDLEKMALVGGQKWIEVLMKVFAHFMPGEAKTFSSEQLSEAWDWIRS
jgi:hypothetical protein